MPRSASPKKTPAPRRKAKAAPAIVPTEHYKHTDESLLHPDIGTQAAFKKRKQPKTYRYDASLDPQLSWDINADREKAEALIAQIVEVAAQLPDASGSKSPLPELLAKLENISAQLSDTANQPLVLAGQLRQVIDQLRPVATNANKANNASTLKGQLQSAATQLKKASSPFLNWAGKAERAEVTVPTLPLFTHERLSTKAILDSVRTRKRQLDLFSDPQLDAANRALQAYEYKDKWKNRLILGDSLTVMNSMLEYDGLGGQVQTIYIDPPYGVKFGSNFQPFIRKRNVQHNADDDLTREPEMVQAYRDTWELGLHSYLAYLRDRLLLARELLNSSGSIFVQISDENLHHVRELMDEVFGSSNFVSVITIRKTASEGATYLGATTDFSIFYAKDKELLKFRPLFSKRNADAEDRYDQIMLPNGDTRGATPEEQNGNIPDGARLYQLSAMSSSRPAGQGDVREYFLDGKRFTPGAGTFKTNAKGLEALHLANRLEPTSGGTLRYRRFADDFPFTRINNFWSDISGAVQSRSDPKVYVVQTSTAVIQRCLLMTTDPGDLVFDPTCGSGTTAYVAEQWGRRWITCDTSRVPLALARQRLLTATFPYYELRDEKAGVHGGFKYVRKQNNKGDEVGGIAPHVTLKSTANNERPEEEILVDRPEEVRGVVRVSGPFVVEATIPTPMNIDDKTVTSSKIPAVSADHYSRMLEALRLSPILRLSGNKTVEFKNVRAPAKALTLHAEAITANNGEQAVAFVFGPEAGAITYRLVQDAVKEAYLKSYSHIYFIGFACQDAARREIEGAHAIAVPATYVNATMDLAMGDLLKTSRASQIFSVTGLPDVRLVKLKDKDDAGNMLYRAELLGLDVFDPVTMTADHQDGGNVPAWLLDTDYNEQAAFVVGQAFFPRTAAWDGLKRALKGTYDDSIWEHLAGTVSEPFVGGETERVAVKVIDDRGNELLVVKGLKEAEAEK